MDRKPGDNLLEDVRFILGRDPGMIVDVGCHKGGTARRYLDEFPQSRVWGFEAEKANFDDAVVVLEPYGDRVVLLPKAVAAETGTIALNVNSHDGTHSVFDIGEQRYWGGHAERVEARNVPAVKLDDVFAQEIDLLHMDIQGAELMALKGASRLLQERRIKLIYSEVEFFPLYRNQPLFWEIGTFLNESGFKLYSLYDRYYHDKNPRALSWADALFVSDELTFVPENVWQTQS